MSISVLLMGLGPLGQRLLAYLRNQQGIKVVGAIDVDPKKQELNLALPIWSSLPEALAHVYVDVAVVSTVSSLELISTQILPLIQKKISVVSTCEELVFPWKTHPDLARQLDQNAQDHGVRVLATGVNPGFLMDYLAVVATGLCGEVHSIRIERVQDASVRRLPFQQKIGAGLTLDQFEEKVRSKTLRHVGLTESMHMIAHALGRELDHCHESIGPVMGDKHCLGVIQEGRALSGGKEFLQLYFKASLGEKNPREEIFIKGTPSFTLQIPGGINGDQATCAVLANAVLKIGGLTPGLKTMLDMPPMPPRPLGV